MKKDIYVFLDWTCTINEIAPDDELKKDNFDKLYNSLKALEQRYNQSVKLIVLSGTHKQKALKVFDILNSAFAMKNDERMFEGVAFEYGSFFVQNNNKILPALQYKLSKKDEEKIEKLAENFGFTKEKLFSSYINFEFDKFTPKVKKFILSCKATCPKLDYETYNDKYGCGMDIKNTKLNKKNFIEYYFKIHKLSPFMLIVGGDSVQDICMLDTKTNCQKYFVGFKNSGITLATNILLSSKVNVDGIADCITKIYK